LSRSQGATITPMSSTPADGELAFPAAADGSRPSTAPGAAIVAAALKALDASHADAAASERHWRRAYPLHFRHLVEGGLRSGEAALRSARAGLEQAWSTFRWAAGGEDLPLERVYAVRAQPFGTHTLRGGGPAAPQPWQLPYEGRLLAGDELLRQVERWVAAGTIEPSAGQALERCARHPEWFDLSDRMLVLLGAASEAGPLRWLSRWRANVVAVDIDRPAVWQRIESTMAQGNGVLHAPVRDPGGPWTSRAGADLLRDAPRVRAWVESFAGPLDIAAHAYLDGERHVRLAMAMDFVQRSALARPGSSLAYLATPTDVFAVPGATARLAMERWQLRPLSTRGLQQPLRLASGDRFFQPNVAALVRTTEGVEYGVVDSLVVEQGPNYALAKRLQQWRALTARAAGTPVSLNVAPSTTTASVVRNAALAAGFAGAGTFGVEAFRPETTNALMAALWVHDLRSEESAANPGRALAHPFELFMENACHGGLWTCAYRPRSALPFAAAVGWVRIKTGRG